jgi:metal-responsive CopG/Arc/MetJ family transcriptional regulator
MGRATKTTGQRAVVSVRLPADLLTKIEALAAQKKFNRSEAIEHLVALGIKANPPYEADLAVLPQHAFA